MMGDSKRCMLETEGHVATWVSSELIQKCEKFATALN
jgi:hypothetical protein